MKSMRLRCRGVSPSSALVRDGWAALAIALWLGCTGQVSAEEFRIGGTGAALGTMRLLADAFTARNADIHIEVVPSLGSGGSVKAVLAGAIGLAVTSRPLTAEERAAGAVETEYARTPFVFAVADRTPVRAITRSELAEVYAGRKTHWPDNSPVRIVLRPASDIDTAMIQSLSPEMRAAVASASVRPGVRFSVNDQDAADDLEKIPGAIGPTSLTLIISERRALRPLQLDGRVPSTREAAAGSYPYFKRLFYVTGARRTAAVERFLAFLNSPGGRGILESNGNWIP